MQAHRGNAMSASSGMPKPISHGNHRQRQCSFYRVCLTCEVSKTCAKCGHAKAEAEFGAAAWKARHTDRRICRGCATKARGQWTCSVCREQCPRSDFSAWEATRSGGRNDGTQRCNQCVQLALVCAIARRANARIERQRQRATRQRQEAILAEVRALIAEKRVRAVAAVASGSLVPAEADMQDTGATACNLAADSARTPQSGAAPTEPATSQLASLYVYMPILRRNDQQQNRNRLHGSQSHLREPVPSPKW